MTSTSSTGVTTTGQCLCGKVKVTVADKPLTAFPTLTCHCTSCKRRSGGIASYAFVVPKQHVQFHPEPNLPLLTTTSSTTSSDKDDGSSSSSSSSSRPVTTAPKLAPAGGVHKVFIDRDTGSGKAMQRSMCAECGSPVCVVEEAAGGPGERCLQFGLFAGVRVDGGARGEKEEEEEVLDGAKPRLEMFASKRVRWMHEVGEDVRETV